ncbi:unnamed protein product [Zymoseptoria tritici ST99CH_1A5]|uniref:Uncharacterized protein n=1 Tax=Zymoseptoria tritici ST99CH_1A5 TaxID=1276529 RepID=A0A1Y6LR40_ZYMTR|nr:unnamed protein product [Zymoseptoria tritici ST99CH_1A5]
MATSFTLSLFLPNTVSFAELPPKEYRRDPGFQLHKRATSSTVDLTSRTSTTSLLAQPTPPMTPLGVTEDFNLAKSELQRHIARPGDPRSLLRSDTHAEWGRQAIFNQPRSRAGPLPSASIQDFAKEYEELKERKARALRKSSKLSPNSLKNRAPSSDGGFEDKSWTVEPAIHGNGGLVNAIRQVTDVDGLESGITWIGTLGMPTDALSDSIKEGIHDTLLNEYQSEVVYCTDKDIDGHYSHYCKTILWPIFHYQVPDHPKSKAYADHSWEFYRNVNQAFADQAISSYKKGDTIWVHDYHLLLVPGMIREKLPEAKIGFFLHTAFPSSEVFRCLSTRKELLEGMLGANLIGFQCDEYSSHFLQTCSRLLAVETTAEGVQLEDHFVNVTSEPIGINPPLFEDVRQTDEVKEMIGLYSQKYKDKLVIVGRDKLDHVHGVRQKLLAYELFLNRNPEYREKVCMIQVATSASEQAELLSTVSDICTRIDSVHATLNHQPLLFLAQDLPFAQYLAMLSIADLLMISALRDGMNLTAHEYIHCQDGKYGGKQHGPLVLSEFTGSAVVFEDKHISINPWDFSGIADAIKQGLDMSAEEKAVRWTRLQEIVSTRTGGSWATKIGERLDKAYDEHHQRASAAVPRLNISQLADKYKDAQNRLFIIDFEGTLAPHRTATGIPLGSPARVVEALNDLMADPRNIFYIMSGRTPDELENHFRTLPKVGLIAENGCFVREFGVQNNKWTPFVDMKEVNNWKAEVRGILEYYKERLEGSYIEERNCSLLFRYEKSKDQEAAMRQAGESADQINGSCKDSMHIHAVPIKGAVLIEQEDFSKGTAAKHVYEALCQNSKGLSAPDFMMIAGDDREDEVIYQWANELGKEEKVKDVFTVTVGKRNTLAQATLTQGSTGLLTVLQKLARISADQLPKDYFNLPRSSTFPS